MATYSLLDAFREQGPLLSAHAVLDVIYVADYTLSIGRGL